MLLDNGADVNAGSFFILGTPRQNACGTGDERVVQLFLGWGADVNARSEHQGTALQVAGCSATGGHGCP